MNTSGKNHERKADQKIVDMVRRSNNQVTPLDMMPGESDQEFMPQHMQPNKSMNGFTRMGLGRSK
ncbi:hypothetical protein [Hymenobacter saemangeumensis]